jgi:anti-sigma factor RsiW
MSTCPERDRVQDYLDGALEPAAARAFRAHLAGCPACARELALYRRVFERLAAAPTWDPGPALTERVLARVLPSRRRLQRRLAALGLGYVSTLVALLGGAAVWATRPGGARALETLSGEASRRLVQTGVFLLNSLSRAALRFAEGWGVVTAAGERLSPVQRALQHVAAQPGVAIVWWAAALVCLAVLWWMRPRSAARGIRHVSVLGF